MVWLEQLCLLAAKNSLQSISEYLVQTLLGKGHDHIPPRIWSISCPPPRKNPISNSVT